MKFVFVTLLAIIGVHAIPWSGNLREFHRHIEPCNHQEGDLNWKKPDFPKFPHTPTEESKHPFLPPSTFHPFDDKFEFHKNKFIPPPGTSFGIPPPPPGFPPHPFGPPPSIPHFPPPNFPRGPPPGFPFVHPIGPPPPFPKIPSYPPPKVPGSPNEPSEPKKPNLPPETIPLIPLIPTETSTADNGVTNEPGVNVNSLTEIVPDQNGSTGSRDGIGRTDSINDSSTNTVTEVQENSNTNNGFNNGSEDTNRQDTNQQAGTSNNEQFHQPSESEIQDIINPRMGTNKKPSGKTAKKSN